MTRRSSISRTGTRPTRAPFAAPLAGLLLLTPLLLAPGARAQSLKLRALKLPSHELVGTWISYHGRSQSRGSAVREFDQRLAVVAKEELGGGRWGLWVELKTIEGSGAERIERGFFAPAALRGTDLLPGGDGSRLLERVEPGAGAPPPPRDLQTPPPAPISVSDADSFVMLRYQVLTTGGKLYEYPVGTTRYSRSSGDVASFELFEYDPNIRPVYTVVGPDTLLLGRRLVPSTVEQIARAGTDRWPDPGQEGRELHLVLTQTFWKNAAVPLTGFARSVFQSEVKAVPAAVDSAAADSGRDAATPDSSLAAAAAPADSAPADTSGAPLSTPGDSTAAAAADPTPAEGDGAGGVLAWTELTLVDLGADARPEIDQDPELAPDFDAPDIDPSRFQR